MTLLTTSHSFPREHADQALNLTDILAETAPTLALDVGEHPDNPDLYHLTWFLDAAHQQLFLEQAQTLLGLAPATFQWHPVDDSIDYVAETRKNFPPLTVGPFFIARNDEEAPADLIALNITPNRAFGSGEHATTKGCLEEYLSLVENGRTFTTGLDVGTGSAILALAALKHGSTQTFVGTDNDAPSVAIAQDNAHLNGLASAQFQAVEDEDLTHPTITAHAPYQIIFANILMLPLVELAPAIAQRLAPGGAVILSGFTAEQQDTVHQAYTAQTLSHHHTRVIATHGAHWCASTFLKA